MRSNTNTFDVDVPALPTNNGHRPPDSASADDITAVRQVVEDLVHNHGKQVIVLMHSYGVNLAGRENLVQFAADGTWFPVDPAQLLYQDLTPKDQQEQTKLLKWGNAAILAGNATYAAWKDVPALYVRSTEDRWLPPEFQDFCLQTAADAGASVEVSALKSGHSPYVEFADRIADMTFGVGSLYGGGQTTLEQAK